MDPSTENFHQPTLLFMSVFKAYFSFSELIGVQWYFSGILKNRGANFFIEYSIKLAVYNTGEEVGNLSSTEPN